MSLRLLRRALSLLGLAATLYFAAAPAQAACTTGACISAGPRLASVDSTRSVLLNTLFGGLLGGGALNLTVADWNALAAGNVSLLQVANVLQANLGVSSPTTALSTNASLGQIVSAAAVAATREGNTAVGAALGRLAPQLSLTSGTIRLGDLIQTSIGVSETQLNVLSLVTGVIQLYNTRNVVSTPTPISLTGSALGLQGVLNNVSLSVQVIEPPVYVCGSAGTSFHSAAIRIKLNLDLVSLSLGSNDLLGALGLVTTEVQLAQLGVYVEVARAEGTITAVDAVANALTVRATPGVADLYIGQMADVVFFNRTRSLNAATDLTPGTIGAIKISALSLITINVSILVKAAARGESPSASMVTFNGVYPQSRTVYTSAAFTANLLSSLVNNLTISTGGLLDGLVAGLVMPIVKLLVQNLLAPLLAQLSTALVDPLLGMLGVRLGEVDLTSGGAYLMCSVAGSVYHDANHSGARDAGENGTGSTLYAKLVPGNRSAGPASAVAVVDPGTGSFVFPTITGGTYALVVGNEPSLTNVTPAGPAGWIGTEQPTLSQAVSVSADVAGRRFGLWRGSKLAGMVFKDNGTGTGGLANNGIRDGTEAPLTGSTIAATDSSGTLIDRAVSGDAGEYLLWLPYSAAGTVRIRQTAGAEWVATGGSAGSTGGTYALASDTTTFTLASGVGYTGVNFGKVPANRFDTDGTQTLRPGAIAFYPHTWIAGTAGTLSLDTSSSVSGTTWGTQLFRDTNCNAVLDAGEAALAGSLSVVADQKVCIIVKVTAPQEAAFNSQYPLTVTARLVYANSGLSATAQRQDLTIVGDDSDGLRLTKTVDKSTAVAGEVITYTIVYFNAGAGPLTELKIADTTPAYTVFTSAGCGTTPAGLSCSVSAQPGVASAGGVGWTFTGSLAGGGQGTVVFRVQVQ